MSLDRAKGERVEHFVEQWGPELPSSEIGERLRQLAEAGEDPAVLAALRDFYCASTMSGSPNSADDESSTQWHVGDVILDLYEVKSVHKGGMGLVHRVRHRGWNMDLAVKTPQAKYFQTERHKENFARECEAWVNLGLHPHVVTCHYVRTFDGIPHVFAEYVEGGSLKEWIESGKLYAGQTPAALQRILDIAIQMAWGLHHAHEKDLIHQDVKPANVMMLPDGTAKVTDFGLARARAAIGETRSSDAQRSILVSCGGMTPAYCSPEQADAKPVSRKTDIWSWAVSLLEMFTGGVRWIAGPTAAQALHDLMSCRLDGARLPSIPEDLAQLLDNCFEPHPTTRPADMLEIASAIRDIYRRVFHIEYERLEPSIPDLTSATVNNRALSMIDLGQVRAAETLLSEWCEANRADFLPKLNLGLVRSALGIASSIETARRYVTEAKEQSYVGGVAGWARRHCRAIHTKSIVLLLRDEHMPSWITADSGGTINIWPNNAPAPRRTMQPHLSSPTAGFLDSITGRVYVGYADGHLLCIDHSNGQVLNETKLKPKYEAPWSVLSGTNIPITHDVIGIACAPGGDRLHVFLRTCDVMILQLPDLTLLEEAHETHHLFSAAVTIRRGVGVVASDLGGVLRYYQIGVLKPECRLNHVEEVFKFDMLAGKATGEKIPALTGVATLAAHPHADILASGSAERGVALIWKIEDFVRLEDFTSDRKTNPNCSLEARHHRPMHAMAFAPHRPWLAFGGPSEHIEIWDYHRRCLVREISCGAEVKALAFTKDGSELAIGGSDGFFLIEPLDPPSCQSLPFSISIPASASTILGRQAVSKKLLEKAERANAVGDYAKALELFRERQQLLDLGTKEARSNLRLIAELPMTKVGLPRIRPIWNQMLTFGRDGSPRPLTAIDFHATKAIAVVGGDGGICHFDLNEMAPIKKTESIPIRDVRFQDTDGTVAVLCTGYMQSCVGIADLPYLSVIQSPSHPNSLNSISALHRPHKALAVCVNDKGELLRWNGGASFNVFPIANEELFAVALSPDESIATVGGMDMRLRVWDLVLNRLERTFDGHEDTISSVDFRPQGDVVASGSFDQSVRIWDLCTHECLAVLRGHLGKVYCVAFAKDGHSLVAGDNNGTLTVSEWPTMLELARITMPYGVVRGACLDKSGFHLAAVYEDGHLCIWELDWNLDASKAGCEAFQRGLRQIESARRGSQTRSLVSRI